MRSVKKSFFCIIITILLIQLKFMSTCVYSSVDFEKFAKFIYSYRLEIFKIMQES